MTLVMHREIDKESRHERPPILKMSRLTFLSTWKYVFKASYPQIIVQPGMQQPTTAICYMTLAQQVAIQG